jgi:hypothetical protein
MPAILDRIEHTYDPVPGWGFSPADHVGRPPGGYPLGAAGGTRSETGLAAGRSRCARRAAGWGTVGEQVNDLFDQFRCQGPRGAQDASVKLLVALAGLFLEHDPIGLIGRAAVG